MGHAAGAGYMSDPAIVTVEKKLVRGFREAARERLLADTLDVLARLETTIDRNALRELRPRFEDSCSLLEYVGFLDEPEPAELIVDLSDWPQHLPLKVLEAQYAAEVRRLQDAPIDGHSVSAADVAALAALVDEIRQKTGAAPRAQRRDQSVPRLLPRHWLRRRDRGS
jgi:hypothetical protein